MSTSPTTVLEAVNTMLTSIGEAPVNSLTSGLEDAELAESILDECNLDPKNIELHLDVSPFEKNNSTSKLSVMLKGYVQGFGVDYRLKPDAWASQTIADKHSK